MKTKTWLALLAALAVIAVAVVVGIGGDDGPGDRLAAHQLASDEAGMSWARPLNSLALPSSPVDPISSEYRPTWLA
jgi:hypothetical protein